ALGGDFPLDGLEPLQVTLTARYPFLDAGTVDRIARAYGTRAERWLGAAEGWQALGKSFGAGLTAAEVDFLRDQDWAASAEDVLWRRTKLGLRLSPAEQQELADYLRG
ncbi:MAG: hypothetical protein RL339_1137, partial [Pseudomonadota bacterium]